MEKLRYEEQTENKQRSLNRGNFFSVKPQSSWQVYLCLVFLLCVLGCSQEEAEDLSMYPATQAKAIELVSNHSQELIDAIHIQLQDEAISQGQAQRRNERRQKEGRKSASRAPMKIQGETAYELALIYGVPIDYVMPVTNNDSKHATWGLGALENNPGNKRTQRRTSRRGDYIDHTTYTDYVTVDDGLAAVFEEMYYRINEYRRMFPDRYPSLRELLENKTHPSLCINDMEGVGFMTRQRNYTTPNPAYTMNSRGDTLFQRPYGRYMTDPNGPDNVVRIQQKWEERGLITPARLDPVEQEPGTFRAIDPLYLANNEKSYFRYQVGKRKILMADVKKAMIAYYQECFGVMLEYTDINVMGFSYRNTQVIADRKIIVSVPSTDHLLKKQPLTLQEK